MSESKLFGALVVVHKAEDWGSSRALMMDLLVLSVITNSCWGICALGSLPLK